jgi:hypothetical protein
LLVKVDAARRLFDAGGLLKRGYTVEPSLEILPEFDTLPIMLGEHGFGVSVVVEIDRDRGSDPPSADGVADLFGPQDSFRSFGIRASRLIDRAT